MLFPGLGPGGGALTLPSRCPTIRRSPASRSGCRCWPPIRARHTGVSQSNGLQEQIGA